MATVVTLTGVAAQGAVAPPQLFVRNEYTIAILTADIRVVILQS